MKKFLLLPLLATVVCTAGFSQGLTGINYQAVARNLNGTVLVNKSIQVRFTITSGNTTTVQYQETQNASTNNYGLFNLVIGKGTPVAGTFSGVQWTAGNQWLQVEVAVDGAGFVSLGKNPLYAVPYALMATQASPAGTAGGDLAGAYPNPTLNTTGVGAGSYGSATTYPTFTVDAKGRLTAATQQAFPPPSGAAGGDLTGTYPNPLLAATTVAAGSYGNATNYSTFTVDAKGRITAAASLPFPAGSSPTGAAGGDLAGTYPNPTINIPFIKTSSQPANPLIGMTNSSTTGTLGAIQGSSASTDANAVAIQGTISSTTPGGFSSAVRGINNSTGGLGIGVWGSQNGSGWGVYGVTPNGIGVYGNSSANGFGVYANSNTGTGLQATSNNGVPAAFNIFNNANNNPVLNANTVGNGTVINVSTTGSGKGVFSSTGAGFAVHGITSQQTSAAIMGDNSGAGEAVVGRTTSDIAGAVVGRNDGGGSGVRGFVATNTSGTGIGVLGQIGLNNSTGRAGRFENLNQTNTQGNTFEVETNGNGNIPDNTQGNAASFLVNNTNSVAAAVRGEVNTIFGNFGAAGVFGVSSGTGGRAGLFYASNPSGNGAALVSLTDGNGNAITANAGKDGNGVETNIDGAGNALYAWVPSFATGRAGRFENFNSSNNNDIVTVKTIGNGGALSAKVDNTQGTSPALKGEVNSIFSNWGTAGVYGLSSGTGGYAGLFHASNTSGNGPALIAIADGNGNGITANASNLGDGVETTADGTGTALFAWTPNFSNGRAGRFVNFNTSNTNPVLTVEQHSAGNIALFKSGNPGTVNVARIDNTGRGFFNGGTQLGGADIAEFFDVEGARNSYEAGDVLVISTTSDRKVEKSSTPYSTLVSGVYATKPGVILTEKEGDANTDELVPMGVIGVIPTKVCMEGGAIKRGDLIVTSSIAGVAMKADPDKVRIGQVIGKALQDYDAAGTGKINVLVSIK